MKKASLLLLWLAFGAPASAQAYLYDTGHMPFTTRIPINDGYIDVNNGEVHLDIPLAIQTVRGRIPLDESLEYDSRIWKIIQLENGSYAWSPTNINDSAGGWRVSTGLRVNGVTNTPTYDGNVITYTNCYGQDYASEEEFINFAWTDPGGSNHLFATSLDQYLPYPCNETISPESTTGYALDGSGYYMTIAYDTNTQGLDIVVYDKEGNEVYPTLQDTNGNYYSEDSNGNLIDTLGRTPVQETTNGNQIYFDVLSYDGGTRARYTVTNEQINFVTAFQQSGVIEAQGYLTAIQSIQLPDGSTYSFTYDTGTTSGHYGELLSITLPTGGVIQFNYQNFEDSYSNENRWLSSIQKDGGTTTLAPQTVTSCSPTAGCEESTTVTSPDGNASTYTFTLDAEEYADANSWNTETDMYQGGTGGTKLKSVNTNYTYSTFEFYNPDATLEKYLVPQEQTDQTSLFSTSGSLTTQTITTLNSIGANPTDVKEWDYYSGAPPSSATLETEYTYGESLNGATLPTEIKTVDGSANEVNDTQISYDQSAPTQTSGLPNHNTPTGPYGDVTTVSEWINTPGGHFITTAAYDDAGAVLTATDPNGTTTLGHDSTDTFVTSLTPPTPSSGVSLTWNWTYDFSTSLLTSTTDPNGRATNYSNYDAFGRVGEIDYPDNGKTTFSYTSTQASIHQYQNASTYVDTEVLYDGYGRKSRVAIENGQGTNPWYQNDICYDENGRVNFESYRYQGTGFVMSKVCSGTGDAFSYDALSRPTAITHGDGTSINYSYQLRATETTDENGVSRIVQRNVFGQPTGICEISSNSGMPGSGSPSACGLDIAGTGFSTTFAYYLSSHSESMWEGSQVRSFQTDSLGRPHSINEPESGQTTYSYVYNSTGLQVTRTRPKANQTNSGVTTTTTTQCDTLGRPVSVTYSDGTASKTFSYDVAQEWGITLQNPKGQLVATSTSANTGAIFGYDPMGRVNLRDQCTPSNCGTGKFQMAYTYDWVGNLLSSTDGMGDTDTYTYSMANEIQSITSSLNDSSDPPNIVSSVQNGPFGPLSWQLGNGLTAVRTYDSLGRINGGWLCSGSSQSYCTGGTQIYGFSDGWIGPYISWRCDTAVGQCSTLGYDEFGRLTSMNYTEGIADSYAWVYDRWGNRWEQNITAGSGPAPQLSFNTSNNQITNTGYGYDAAGDVTADGSHTYSYDAEGNLTLIDSGSTATFTFDAENERVRRDIPGKPSNEYIFNVFGQRASVWDATDGWASKEQTYWGSTPVELHNSGAAHYQEQDWLGTERMTTDHTGGVEGTYTSLPFGDGFHVTGSDPDQYHFAGLDYEYKVGSNGGALARFRMYYNTAGNWMSPDPNSGSYDFTNPQSFDRYSYVTNNPMSATDPQGLDVGTNFLPICGDECGGGGFGGGSPFPCIFFCGGGGGGGGIGPFLGSLKPRPNGQPWDEYNIHWWNGANIATALGLPDETCEFGACGGIPGENFGPAVAVGGTVICQIAEPCGAIEDGLLVGGLILTGAAAIWEMSQHGRGNVADTGIENEARQKFPNLDMCSALDLLMKAAKAAGDTQKQMRIKKTQKAYGCRQSRG